VGLICRHGYFYSFENIVVIFVVSSNVVVIFAVFPLFKWFFPKFKWFTPKFKWFPLSHIHIYLRVDT